MSRAWFSTFWMMASDSGESSMVDRGHGAIISVEGPTR